MAWAIFRVAPTPFRQLLRDIVFLYGAPVVPFALAWWLGGENLWLRFTLSIVALGATFAVYAWRFGSAFRDFLRK